MYTIGVRLDNQTRAKLEYLARITGRSRSLLVAEAVRRFVDEALPASGAQEEPGANEEPDKEGKEGVERWNLIV